jgi:hypothetical protein
MTFLLSHGFLLWAAKVEAGLILKSPSGSYSDSSSDATLTGLTVTVQDSKGNPLPSGTMVSVEFANGDGSVHDKEN